MRADDLCFLSLVQVAGLVRSRQVSPVELVEACLGRIERLNPVLNAFGWVDADGALRAAGAILLGKTTMNECAWGVDVPPTRNPWDPARMPGGSSGGSGVAVAAGLSFVPARVRRRPGGGAAPGEPVRYGDDQRGAHHPLRGAGKRRPEICSARRLSTAPAPP